MIFYYITVRNQVGAEESSKYGMDRSLGREPEFCCKEAEESEYFSLNSGGAAQFGDVGGERPGLYYYSYGATRRYPIRYCPFCGALIIVTQHGYYQASVVKGGPSRVRVYTDVETSEEVARESPWNEWQEDDPRDSNRF